MCIYTVKKQKLKILKNSPRGVRDSTERPKLGVPGVKDTAKTNKDLHIYTYSIFKLWKKNDIKKIDFRVQSPLNTITILQYNL